MALRAMSERGVGAEVPGVLRVPGWEKFPWLVAGFSTRRGGGSTVYSDARGGEQNLGWTPDDDAEIVAENRRGFMRAAAGEQKFELVTVRQVHGTVIQVVERGPGSLSTAEGKAVLQGDGLATREAGLMLGVQTADCVPILIADTRTRAVGALHAGWRGTVAGMVEAGARTMAEEFGSRPDDLIAAVGPSIGPCCFEVGGEVSAEFEGAFSYAGDLISKRANGKAHIDLWGANRRQLLDVGVPPEAITVMGECTACSRLQDGRRKYFSHRAENGFTGRMLSVVGVKP
jgi:YfiH family protein